jgi:hypothetical protein
MKIPAHVWALAIALALIICTTILVASGHVVPSWFQLAAVALIGGALGIAVPGVTTSSTTPTVTTTATQALPAGQSAPPS